MVFDRPNADRAYNRKTIFKYESDSMDTVAATLNEKLTQWSPVVAERVRRQILEIMEMADQDILDILRSRQVEQDVLDLLDEDKTSPI